jgi:Cu(I)/Ag(I) efflux system membrane protein CusA/SilA
MWAAGTGSDVMKRIAAPMIGGILTSFLLELVVYPPLYQMWKARTLPLVIDPPQTVPGCRPPITAATTTDAIAFVVVTRPRPPVHS